MKLDRLIGILIVLLQDNRVTANFLAKKFEVTCRTISRDIYSLCQAGIPIVTYQGYGGGISISEGFKLDKSVLTHNELSSIITAIKGIGSVSEKLQIEKILDKLSLKKDAVMSMKEPIIIDLASHYRNNLTEKIELIKKAIHDQRLIEFEYCYEKGQMHRSIEPYFVIFQWMSWYVFGFCTYRNDWRMFKLMRLNNLQIMDRKYSTCQIPIEKSDLNSFLSDDKKLVAIFDKETKYKIMEVYGSDCFKETEDEKLLLEIGFTNDNYIISWLLSFGSKVKVIEPLYIALEIQKIAQKILESY